MKKKIIFTTIIVSAVLAGLVLLAKNFNKELITLTSTTETNNDISAEADSEGVEMDEFVSDPDHQLTYSGWIPNWASTEGQKSFVNNADLFTDISPVWYEVKEDGSLLDKKPSNYNSTIKTARENNILIIPAIAMFDFELFSKVLNSQENLDRHVAEIIEEVDRYDYDGIDLDYESTAYDDKEEYFLFLEELSTELHERDKKLVVTVLAKWGDNVNYPSLPETREVQDWSEIAIHADEIRIMAYDYTFSKALLPGPIAPIDWVERVLDYAVQEIPREKLVLGVHLYSYEWYQEVSQSGENPELLSFEPDLLGNSNSNPGQARSYTYDVVKKVLASYDGEMIEFQGEQIYRYTKVNDSTGKLEDRVLVYIDPEGIQLREDLAREYNIKGVVFWRLGNEAELLTELH